MGAEQVRAKRSLDAILGAAAELVGEQGTDGFSMAELARRAGVSKPALYRYFPNKRAILVRLARASFEDNTRLLAEAMTARPGASEAEIYREAIGAYCALQRSQPFRAHLRAAMAADPELAALDLEDSRRNAELATALLRARHPELPADTLQARALLLMVLVDALAGLSAQVEDAEAAVLIRAFVEMTAPALGIDPAVDSTR